MKIMVRCPSCGEWIEFQTRFNEGDSKIYTLEQVSNEILEELQWEHEKCLFCGMVVTIDLEKKLIPRPVQYKYEGYDCIY